MPASGLPKRREQSAGVDERALRDQPHRDEHRERQRGDREVEAGDAQRRNADEHGDGRAHEHAERRPRRPTAGRAGRGHPTSPTSFTVMSPPTAANPNWPSDSWPAHPVRMVSEHPAIAKISTRVQRNDSDAREKNTGISTSTRTARRRRGARGGATTTAPSQPLVRTGVARLASFQPPSSGDARQAREHEHDHERRHEQPQLGDAEVARERRSAAGSPRRCRRRSPRAA